MLMPQAILMLVKKMNARGCGNHPRAFAGIGIIVAAILRPMINELPKNTCLMSVRIATRSRDFIAALRLTPKLVAA